MYKTVIWPVKLRGIEQYFPVIFRILMLYKVIPTVEPSEEDLFIKCLFHVIVFLLHKSSEASYEEILRNGQGRDCHCGRNLTVRTGNFPIKFPQS